jgi:DNA polymerase-3 subunit alpha
MGKKKAEEMAKQKATFVEGALKNGHASEDAERVFELMSYFSGYGFNKSHSAAYALVAYQCAYLKAHYPVEFLCATMTADKDKIDKVVRTIAEARDMGITVLPPDVNESEISFTVVYSPGPDAPKRPINKPVALAGTLRDPMRPRIRFGLGAVKGVGSAALEAIFDGRARREDGSAPAESGKEPFLDLFDFTARVDLRRVNKAVVEALVLCGAFDSLHEPRGIHRAQALAAADAAIERGKSVSADRESGQTDLFGMLAPEPEAGSATTTLNGLVDGAGRPVRGTAGFPSTPPWERKEKLRREKATLGFYLSGHPLDGYREELKRFCKHTTTSVTGLPDKSQVTIGGVIEDLRVRPMRTGGKVGFFQLEDPFGRLEVIVRDKALEAYRELLQVDAEVLVQGTIREERDQNADPESDQPAEVKLVLESVTKLGESLRARTKSVRVRMHVNSVDRAKLVELRRALEDFPGNCPVTLQLNGDAWHVTMGAKKISVDPSEQMLARLERLFGEKVCELR